MEEGLQNRSQGILNHQDAGEGYYRRIFEDAIEGICLADRETGVILDCNQAFLRLTGYERSELIGQPQIMLHPVESGNLTVTRNFALHRSEKQGEVISDRLVTKSGAVKEVDIKAGPLEMEGRKVMHAFFRDRTEELRTRRERETTLNLMRLLNDRNQTHELIRNVCTFLQNWSGCEAVGIRLRDGDDFPYFETRGFPAEFVELENYLCQRDLDGQVLRDELGHPLLDCMCGNILCGRFDPALPFFTTNGSFWSNCTTELLASTTEAQRQARTRNRCNGEGYESVALIPLQHGDRVLGLLQLNDHARGRFTPELISFLENTADQIAIALAQRQAQAALEIAEERYRRIFEVESDAMLLVDSETLRIIDANEAAIKLYGYTREEFLRLESRDISAEPENTLKSIAGRQKHIPLRWHCRKDGTVFPVEIGISHFESQGQQVHVTAIRDITERRQAEETLRESEKRFRSLFESSMDAVFLSIPDGTILSANQAACAMFGMTEEEICRVGRKGLFDTLDPRYLAALEERARKGKIQCELTGVRKDGTKFPVEVSSVITEDGTRSFVIFHDITLRKQNESRLVQAHERLELAKKAAKAGVWDWDIRTGRVEWSPEIYAILGLDPAKVEPTVDLWRSRIHPDDLAAADKLIQENLENQEKYSTAYRVIKSDGEVLWLSDMGYMTYDDERHPIRVTGVCWDFTEQKTMENSLRESEERYRGLFDNMTEACSYHRMLFEDGEPVDYIFLSVNEAFEALTGLKDVIGKKVTELIPGIRETDADLFEIYGRVAKTGKPEKFERYVEAMKSWFDISVYSPEDECFVVLFEVITERKNAEIALRKSEDRFSKAFHCSPLAMVISSLLDRRVIDVNEAFEKITGYRREEVLGQNIRTFGILVDSPALEEAIQTLRSQGNYFGYEVEVRTKAGEYRVARLSAETVEIGGEPCALTIAEDITERQHAENALRKSEALFSKAFHGSPIAMALTTILDQRILNINESFEKQSGYARQDLVGRSAREVGIFFNPQDIERGLQQLAIEGKIQEFECSFRTHSGHERLALLSTEIVEIGDELCLLTVAEDITDRKRSAEALRLSEERFRQMFEHMGSGMVVYEVVGDGADFLIKEFNPAAERMGKISRAEVVGRPVSETFPDLERIGLVEIFRRVWRTGIPEYLPASLYHDDRLTIWVENYVFKLPSGEVVAIIDNITDRKSVEAELRKSEIWHRSLIELGVSMYVVLDEKRRIQYASPLVEKVLGWTPAEVLRKSIFDFVDTENAELAARFFVDILRAPKRKKRVIAPLRCKDGELKAMELFGINLLDEPAVRGIVLSSHDITEQVRAQERVDAFREELTHASRLASMGALTAGIAHEINQPLSIIATWAEIASREIRDHLAGDKQEALLALMRIDAAMERSCNIIQRMKDFSRKSEPRITKVSIAEAIDEVHLLVEHQLRASGVSLSLDVPATLPPALADRTQVQQVLTNLILNAVEAMKSVESRQSIVGISAKTNNGMLEVAVCDTGCSIPADRLESIFEPFHSTKPEGLGLGLSICRTIIQWHGGRIGAARNAERGTTVTFTLPIALENHPHATQRNHLHRGRRTGSH